MFEFSKLLKELRAKKGVSQVDLAKAIGVSNGNVGDWERGRSKPGFDALIELSRFFEISPARLLGLPTLDQTLSCDGIPLTESEADLIAMYRLLPGDHREDVFDIVHRKYTRLVAGGEKASIYSTYSDTREQQKSAPDLGDETKSGTA